MFYKTRSIAAKFGRQVAVGSVVVAAGIGNALADAAAATTAITASSGDVSTIGWASLGLLIVAAAFKYMRRTV
jgi:hypothetical protein